MSFRSRLLGAVAAGVAVGLTVASLHGQQARKVDEATLLKPADGDWVGYGRDYDDVAPIVGIVKIAGKQATEQSVDVVPAAE